MIIPKVALISFSLPYIRRYSPKGIPMRAQMMSHFALQKYTNLLSCTTTTAAITMESRTERVTAVSIGIKKMSRGTAISDSPNPKVDRTNVATKTMSRIQSVVGSIYFNSCHTRSCAKNWQCYKFNLIHPTASMCISHIAICVVQKDGLIISHHFHQIFQLLLPLLIKCVAHMVFVS